MRYFVLAAVLLVIPVLSGATVDLKSGLIAHWEFEEGSGGTAKDTSGNGWDGTLQNGPVWVDGKIGKALSFDGVDDFVRIKNSADIAEGGSLSVVLWMRPRELNYQHEIISKHKSGLIQWRLEQLESNRLSFTVRDTNQVSAEPEDKTLISDLDWHHVVGTYDQSRARLYVDGVKVGETIELFGGIANEKHEICIGSYWNGNDCEFFPNNRPFYGYLDDVRIYSRALSAEEVKELYRPEVVLPTSASEVVSPPPPPASEPSPTPAPKPTPTAAVSKFTRDLSVGSIGEDVRELQRLLNNNGFIIALNGPGSPGNESMYFGALTKSALIKFQEFYSFDILAPSGLAGGTGYFGPATRKKINTLAAGLPTGAAVITPAPTAPQDSTISDLQKQILELQALVQKLQEQIKSAQ